MTDLAKGMLKRGDRMDEAIIAYIIHEALTVSALFERWMDLRERDREIESERQRLKITFPYYELNGPLSEDLLYYYYLYCYRVFTTCTSTRPSTGMSKATTSY